MELYKVYDNRIDVLIFIGTYEEVKDYMKNEDRYRVELILYY